MKARLLFFALVTPLAVLGRPLWRARLGVGPTAAGSYWRTRDDTVTRKSLRKAP